MRLLSDATPHTLVYLLADARSGPYYIEVAPDFEAILQRVDTLHRWRMSGRSGTSSPFLLVWLEACEHEAHARNRAAEIRAWPQRWQRCLIESKNPYWLDVKNLIDESPPNRGWRKVFETPPKPCSPATQALSETQLLELQQSCELLPQESLWYPQARQWFQTIQACHRPPQRWHRYKVPVYTPHRVALAEACHGFSEHGIALLTTPCKNTSAGTPLLAWAGNQQLGRTANLDIGFVSHRVFDVADHGVMQVFIVKMDIDPRYFGIENTLAETAALNWLGVGRPARHVVHLEIDTVTSTAYRVQESGATRGKEELAR